jgi:hypothetical protein
VTAQTVLAQTAGGSALASWTAFQTMMIGFAVVLAALFVYGRGTPLLRINDALERVTRIPGWAAATVGLALFGLLVAGQGFYSDVAWHVGLGRDEELFTAPHTAIVVGLGLILISSAVGIFFATLSKADVGFRRWGLTIPWSTLPLGALGLAAVSGFPLDELWHAAYGVDVTMWSPTHMLMILGASFTGVAGWLVLAEAGVKPTGAWGVGVHAVAAWLALQGLAASQGEFAFGVPQFQQLFHPVLLAIAAGFGLVAARLICGRGWALGVAVAALLLEVVDLFGEETGPVDTRVGGIYIASGLAIELVALIWGTDRKLRFALLSGVGVGTIGFAGEWVWNQGAYQPWTTNLLPDAIILAVVAGVGAAIGGVAFTGVRLPRLALWGALGAVLVSLALPMPRHVGDVDAALEVTPAGDGMVDVRVTLDPPDAADEARWFQAISWQGGGLGLAEMEPVEGEDGVYESSEPVPADGYWKTLVRLHRHDEMMAIPVFLPEDEEIGEPEIPAEDRQVSFQSETAFLLRETVDGEAWFKWVIYGLLAAAAALWLTAFCVAVPRIRDERRATWSHETSAVPSRS